MCECVRETQILVAHVPPQGVLASEYAGLVIIVSDHAGLAILVSDHAGLVINKLSVLINARPSTQLQMNESINCPH